MKARSPWLTYATSILLPALFEFNSIGANQSLCAFARERALCLQENSWSHEGWKIALAGSIGWAVATLLRNRGPRRAFRFFSRRAGDIR